MNREDVAMDVTVQNVEILRGRLEQAEALLREMRTIFSIPPYWHERIDALLALRQGERNQCDGCQAGIPLVDGAHRMGRPGGYPDMMSCQKERYEHPEQAEGAHVPDEVFEAEFMTWWEEEGKFCRSGGGDYERTFAFQAWRHLYPQLMAPRAALAQPSPLYDPKRCLACGGDHGNSGLPCPNMRVTAQAQPSPAPELEAIAQEMKPLPTEFARVIEEHLQELLIKGEQAPELERPEVVAFRLLNQLGEVMTEWHDGKPPEKFADLCGNPVTDVQVQAAYAGPVIKALPDWPPCSKACMPAHGGHRDLQCNCEQATRAKAEVMQDLELPQPVGWLNRDATRGSGIWLSRHRVVTERQIDEGALTEPVMTVAQHERILRQALGAHDDQSE